MERLWIHFYLGRRNTVHMSVPRVIQRIIHRSTEGSLHYEVMSKIVYYFHLEPRLKRVI